MIIIKYLQTHREYHLIIIIKIETILIILTTATIITITSVSFLFI